MSKSNQNLKQRLVEKLNQIPENWALIPLLGNIAPHQDNVQVVGGNKLSLSQHSIKAQMATEVGGTL